MRSLFLLIGILILASGSCSKDELKDNSLYVDTPETLIGSWNWLYSAGGYAGTISTPQSTGETKKIEFDIDNNLRLFVNGQFKNEQKFTIEKGKSIAGRDSVLLLNHGFGVTGMRQSIIFRTADTLILFDECYDCYEHHFSRIK
jgi:hypothetical protein